jgi:hypothetical protein
LSINNDIGLFAPFIIPLFILFVLTYPLVLDKLITSLRKKSRIPVYLSITTLSIIFSIIGMTLSGAPPDPLWTGAILVSLLTVSAMAVLMPYSFFKQGLSGKKKRIAVIIGSAIQIPLLFALLVNPESWANGPPPLFADRLPGVGIIFDAVATALGTAGKAGYDVFFSTGIILGFYIEVAIVSAVVYVLIAALWRE